VLRSGGTGRSGAWPGERAQRCAPPPLRRTRRPDRTASELDCWAGPVSAVSPARRPASRRPTAGRDRGLWFADFERVAVQALPPTATPSHCYSWTARTPELRTAVQRCSFEAIAAAQPLCDAVAERRTSFASAGAALRQLRRVGAHAHQHGRAHGASAPRRAALLWRPAARQAADAFRGSTNGLERAYGTQCAPVGASSQRTSRPYAGHNPAATALRPATRRAFS
jgi:hypothetical protein